MFMFILPYRTDYRLQAVLEQSWESKQYSYLKEPRRNFGLLFVLKGEIDYITECETIHLLPGDLIFLPENSYYEVVFHTEKATVQNYLINFGFDSFSDVEVPKYPVLLLNDASNLISQSFQQLCVAFNGDNNAFSIQALFYKCLYNISLLQNKIENKDYLNLEIAKKALMEEYAVSIEEIAKRLSMSRSSLQKKFKDNFGQSPIEFRTSKKIEKAKILLTTTDMPIKEIAFSLNYYDVACFYKEFNKHCGISPKKFRENIMPKL
jgi:AraC-like DNA-binding protein